MNEFSGKFFFPKCLFAFLALKYLFNFTWNVAHKFIGILKSMQQRLIYLSNTKDNESIHIVNPFIAYKQTK